MDISAIIDIDRCHSCKKTITGDGVCFSIHQCVEEAKGIKTTESVELTSLTAKDIELAESVWIKSIQRSSFARELEYLIHNRKTSPPQYVQQFGLYVDKNEILRCEGRIDNSTLDCDSKHPILLPSNIVLVNY